MGELENGLDVTVPAWKPNDIDRTTGPVMSLMSLVVLVLVGLVLHLGPEHDNGFPTPSQLGAMILACYWVFPGEALLHWFLGRKLSPMHWCGAFLPVLRFGAKDHDRGSHVWFPWCGWRLVDPVLERELQRLFSWPMMGVAILILPVVAAEYVWAEAIAASGALQFWLELATAMIWVAFVIEYVTMISVTKNKWRYALRNWLDLVVIMLPVLAFLRAAQIGRLARLRDLSRTVRAYRLKGMTARWSRAIMALNVADRLARRDPESYLIRLQEQRDEKRNELADIESKIERIKLDCQVREDIQKQQDQSAAKVHSSRRAA